MGKLRAIRPKDLGIGNVIDSISRAFGEVAFDAGWAMDGPVGPTNQIAVDAVDGALASKGQPFQSRSPMDYDA